MSDKNELDWEEYEAITKYIYGAMGEKYGIKVIGYGRNCKVKGKSGATYQIDVLTEQSDGKKKHQTAIECKFIKKKVTNDTVIKLWGVMEDAGIENGIIVCKTGFTKNTLLYAAHKGIKLVELWEAQENDRDFKRTFEVGILDIRSNIMLERANITSIDFGSQVITGKEEVMAMCYAKLYDSYGREIPFSKYILIYSNELKDRGELLKAATINVPFTGKLFWRLRDKEIAIEKIAITGFVSRTDQSQTRSFVLTDQVWMIMKELFDKRNLTMSKSGLIWNLSQN
ncbi:MULTISPECIES: restriction endonuclease [Sinomicrobium]|uniref:restriction endonuclease n=1 Tax=Sinomicrobium TaxID=1434045 RepID=UPI001374EC27|nr:MULTISPECIES: restriction endonuclease [Sinomicrobium]